MSKRICQLSLLLLWMLSGSVMGDEARGLYLNGARGTIMKFDNGMRFSLISQGKEKKASDACAVFPLGDAIRKDTMYR